MANACNQNPSGSCSTAEGFNTTASGNASHAEGGSTTASASASHAEGYQTLANGDASHAEGSTTTASGAAAHAEGLGCMANANAAHAEGFNTLAAKDSAHAEGALTQATGESAHAEGVSTKAIADGSHAEGYQTIANKDAAHAEGTTTTASGTAAHAEGATSIASGNASHAEGISTVANGEAAHAEGLSTSAGGFAGAHIMGRFGTAQAAYSWFIGNGTSSSNLGLGAKWIASSGNMFVDGSFVPGGADYAELFETIDGRPIDVGYFVTTEGNKVYKANESSSYIVGVTSSTPGIIGDSAELSWQGKYLTDQWGRIQVQEVLVPAKKDKEDRVIIPEHNEVQRMLNPNWDNQKEYIPRLQRPEWVPVGLLGKLLVRDDGTCEVNGYCKSNHEGIATKASRGFRILERKTEDQILILFVTGCVF
jgi:hypothetical protein